MYSDGSIITQIILVGYLFVKLIELVGAFIIFNTYWSALLAVFFVVKYFIQVSNVLSLFMQTKAVETNLAMLFD